MTLKAPPAAAVLGLAFILTACQKEVPLPYSSLPPYQTNQVALKAALTTITVQDGINREEADIMAWNYFHSHVGCGSYIGVDDGGRHWVVEGLFGYAGRRVEGTIIHKKTGEFQSTIGPSYGSPEEMRVVLGN